MKLTYEMAEKIFDMKRAGKSIKEISEELGVSDQTVRNRLKSAEETKAEPEEKQDEAPEKAEQLQEPIPELDLTIERFRLKGTVADYVVDDGEVGIEPKLSRLDSTIRVDMLPEFIRELQAVVKKLEQGI